MPDAAAGPSLTVLGGPLKGRRFSLEPKDTLVGADPTCHVSIPMPGVSPVHARVRNTPGGFRVQDGPSATGLFVNDDRVNGEAAIHDADVLWLGPPGEPSSVMLSLHLPAPAAPVPEPAGADEFLIDEAVLGAAAPQGEDEFIVADEADVAGQVATSVGTGPTQMGPTEVLDGPTEVVLDDSAAAPGVDEVFFVDEAAPPPAAPPTLHAEPEETAAIFTLDEPATDFVMDAPVEAVEPEPVPPPAPPPPPAAPPPRAAAPARPAPVEAPPPTTLPPPAPKPAAPVQAQRPSPSPAPPRPAPEAPTRPAARPAAAARPAPAARRSEPAPAPKTPAPARAPGRGSRAPLLLGLGVVLALLAGGAFFMLKGGGPVLESVTPDRAKIGQTLVLSGRGFGATPSVLFGERKATLVSASPTRIEAQVPLFPVLPGRDSKVDVAVEVGGRKTTPVSVAVYQGPRLDGLSPDVALPGEEIELAGAGWQSQPVVRFGQVPGEVLSESPTAIRVRVPPLDTAPGSRVEVVVESGGEQSNVAPFLIGKLPIVSRVDPQAVGAGDTVTVTGRGFRPKAADNLVKVGAVRALVSQATESELRFVVPWTESPGEAPLEIHVKGIENVGRGTLTVNPPGGDVVDLHFVPEPLPVDDTPDHDHAVLSIELGPVFVLTATQGRSAAERAVEAARALNGAVGAVKASLEADFALDPPRLLLAGRPETLLEATPEDAQAYGEDWTHAGARNRGGSPGRLSVWWNAVARDLVLLLIRSQKPQYAVALAPEGRLFVDIFQAARKTGGFGVPRTVLHDMKPPVVEQMRSVALRLPASVPEPSAGTVGGPPGAGPGGPAATLQLQGVWRGTEVVRGERNYLTFTFRPKYSTAQMGSGLTVDIVGLQVGKDGVRFSLPGNRYYSGTWDGQKISGTVSSDAAGKDPIGTFELVSGQ